MRRYPRRKRVMGQVPTPPLPVDPVVPPVVVPPVQDAPPVVPPTPPVPPAPEPQTFSKEYVEQLRNEAAQARIAKKTADDALKVLQDAQLTVEQRTASDLKALQEVTVPALRQENRKLQVQVAASALGIVDPEVASMLIDWSAVDTGTTINDALTAVLVARPYLKAAAAATDAPPPVVPPVVPPIVPVAPPSGSNPATPPGTGAARQYTKSELSRMSQRDMLPILEDVKLAAAQGRIDYTR